MFMFYQERKVLDGRSWSLAEVPCGLPAALCEVDFMNALRRPDPPAVVMQHLQVERKFVIINSKVEAIMFYFTVVSLKLPVSASLIKFSGSYHSLIVFCAWFFMMFGISHIV